MDNDQLWIQGKWEPGLGDDFLSLCPVDNSIVWSGKEATQAQVDRAFLSARQAFGGWWDFKVETRIEFVKKFRDLVREDSEDLATLIAQETGKPLWESRTEASAVAAKVDLSIAAFRERRDTTSFEVGGMNAVTRYKPHGVCGVLGPFNFPAHLANGHIVPALITGNTVVFKPSELTPAVGAWMVRKWTEVGLPPGVINLIQGGRTVGESLTLHPELDGLFFTGSSKAGVAIHQSLSPFPQKILALEMGGNNPLIVSEIDDPVAAAYHTILSAYFTAGQRCTCARRLILIDNQESKEFLDVLIDLIGKIRIGFFDDDPQPFMGTVISQEMGRRILKTQEEMMNVGGQPLVKIKSHRQCDALVSPGLMDMTNVPWQDEELFGPLLSVIRVPDFQSAIHEANRTAYGLSAGLLSDNEELYRDFIHQIRAGIVNWNRQTTGASGKLPFGGCGLSGNHRPSAYFAVDYCSFPVASLESSRLELPEQLLTGIEVE
ncbi:MAG: succinylglutamate-semialdehyde dehydrogenase [Planctomycetota bacterium]